MKAPVTVTVTGANGNIGYAILFRIASGGLLGPDQPIRLRLMELEAILPALEGTVMELDDCAFPLLADVDVTSDYKTAFDGTSWALLVGSVPRKQGMERKDLLTVNGASFQVQGQALNEAAADDVRILVVGNPCNTNCLTARANARDIPDDRWFAMTRLDQNRAKAILAHKAGAAVADVANVAIWGNHSNTQYPDGFNATIGGKPGGEVITDHEWLRGEFVSTVQQRGAAVIAARGASSAGSAANAAIGSVRSIIEPTAGGDCASVAVVSHGEYGVPEGLVFGYPIRSDGSAWSVAEGFELDEAARGRITSTVEELQAERAEVADLL